MELEFIAWLRQRLPPHPHLRLGAGDDAALLRMAAGPDCVVTSDLLMDQVDFRLEESDPRRIGRKALAVNLSDLAAMASHPLAAVVSLALPNAAARELGVGLYEGMLPLADEFNCPIAGGDTNCWDGPLVISITALGLAPRGAWQRSGAQVGDDILVTGDFGGSLLAKHFDFRPRLAEARYLSEHSEVHACIDVSDGLSLDLSRLAHESHRGAELDLDLVPISDAARRMAERDGVSALDHALGDGEDFELILATPPAETQRLLANQPLGVPLHRIGRFIETPGLWRRDGKDGCHPLTPRGYQHGPR
jgi:thiamine-monophosphate kinase